MQVLSGPKVGGVVSGAIIASLASSNFRTSLPKENRKIETTKFQNLLSNVIFLMYFFLSFPMRPLSLNLKKSFSRYLLKTESKVDTGTEFGRTSTKKLKNKN